MSNDQPNESRSITVLCRECSMEVVCLPEKTSPPGMETYLYEGSCSNSIANCRVSSTNFFCCRLCIQSQERTGKSSGYIAQWKYVQRHSQTSFHQKKVEQESIHQSSPSVDDQNGLDCFDSDQMCQISSPQPILDATDQIPTEMELFQMGFDQKSTTPKYLIQEAKEKGSGIRWLTANSFGLSSAQVSTEESIFCLKISSLLVQLTEQQKKIFAEILTTAGNSGHSQLSIFQNIRLPSTTEDFDRFFLTGKNAILPNLPHPIPKTTPDGSHSYVSLYDLLANEIGKATEYDDFDFMAKLQIAPDDAVPSVSSTQCAKSLLFSMKEEQKRSANGSDQFTLYLWLREWRDDFDPNNTKSSRNQVWCNTYTLCPPHQSTNVRGSTTYYIGLSSKGEDHNKIEEIMTEELDTLSSTGLRLYHGGLKKVIHVMVGKLLISVDRPERTTIFRIGDHNGSYSAFWGYATNVDGTCQINHLPSCTECKKKRLQRLQCGFQVGNTARDICESCSDWRIEDPNFVFVAPADYPQVYDQSPNAPKPPILRDLWHRIEDIPVSETDPSSEVTDDVVTVVDSSNDVVGQVRKKRRKKSRKKPTKRILLRSVKLTVSWLKQAVLFACHNVTHQTIQSNGSRKKFWTKGNFNAFLKTCALTNRMIESIYQQCTTSEEDICFPTSWKEIGALAKCHFAPMHMLFLGHAKSNLEMVSKWLGKYNRLAPFGKQVNKVLEGIRSLRATKFFCAQPLSTSSWGTGVWVSENYLLGARIWRFLMSLPSICDSRWFRTPGYKDEWRSLSRFITSMAMCLGRIMTNCKTIGNLEDYIHLYMDHMAEVDLILFESDRQKKNPNFTKSNSLGILSCATAHSEMGPAILHWEGGWEGERKIQQVKPLLSIKRSTADWTTITMRKLYQYDTLQWMLNQADASKEKSRMNRESDSMIRIFKSRSEMEDHLSENGILCGVLGRDNNAYIAYRPIGEETGNTRRLVKLCRLRFQDEIGEWTQTMCWVAPVLGTSETRLFQSVAEMKKDFVQEVLLLIPLTSSTTGNFINSYYTVGNLWRERWNDGSY